MLKIKLFLGVASISSNALNVILVVIGGCLLLEGIWLVIALNYLGLLIDGILIAALGVWNILTSFLNAKKPIPAISR